MNRAKLASFSVVFIIVRRFMEVANIRVRLALQFGIVLLRDANVRERRKVALSVVRWETDGHGNQCTCGVDPADL